jgi:hypothetical protein
VAKPLKPISDDVFSLAPVDNSVLNFIGGSAHAVPSKAVHHSEVIYQQIRSLAFPTGVRAEKATSDQVAITGSTQVTRSDGTTLKVAAIFEGTLQSLPNALLQRWHVMNPAFANVTASLFYGPNTSLFDPTLGTKDIRAVGTYEQGDVQIEHGMIYQGPLDGSGTWTPIDANALVTPGNSLHDTIPHSTMGTLVVGNYDFNQNASPGHAFVYNMANKSWFDFQPVSGAFSTTAYGIWQNGALNSTSYTIAGGYSDLADGTIDKGYVADYDATSRQITHVKEYTFKDSGIISHFDGITATATGYNLTGEFVDPKDGGIGGFFASITREADGTFSEADWTTIKFPDAALTSGNTVIGNTVLGIHISSDTPHLSSYVATILQT